MGCGRAPSHGKSSTESLNSHWRLRPGTAGCGLNSPCADRSANGEDSGARSQLAGEGVRANGSRLRGTEGEEEEESIIAPAAAPASASSSTARRSRRQGADFACDPIMIAVIASSTAPRLPASLQDLGSSPKEAKTGRTSTLPQKNLNKRSQSLRVSLSLLCGKKSYFFVVLEFKISLKVKFTS